MMLNPFGKPSIFFLQFMPNEDCSKGDELKKINKNLMLFLWVL